MEKQLECSFCEWCKSLEDSKGDLIYYCMNHESGAYLEETGICGSCIMEIED